MENNNENQEKKINTEELKSETLNTVNEVKETIKNVNVKKDALETKGFITDIIKDPLGKIKAIVDDNNNKFLKYAIILIVVWMAAILVKSVFGTTYFWKYGAFKNMLSIIKSVIAPAIGILSMSVIILILNKENKKTLSHLVTVVTTAKIPLVMSAVVSLLTILSSSMSSFTTPFSKFCSVISIILTYFALKNIFAEKENSKFVKRFALIEAIYCVVYFVFTFLGIYI